MTSTMTPNARLGELRAQREEAQSRMARLRTTLGAAVADGDEVQAATTRAAIETLQRQLDELAAAVPIVEQRAQEAQQRDERERQAASARLHNERRAAKLAAAQKVDEAMRALGAAWAEFESQTEVSNHAASSRPYALRCAMFHWAPTLGARLELRRANSDHFRPLAESEGNATATMQESDQ